MRESYRIPDRQNFLFIFQIKERKLALCLINTSIHSFFFFLHSQRKGENRNGAGITRSIGTEFRHYCVQQLYRSLFIDVTPLPAFISLLLST